MEKLNIRGEGDGRIFHIHIGNSLDKSSSTCSLAQATQMKVDHWRVQSKLAKFAINASALSLCPWHRYSAVSI